MARDNLEFVAVRLACAALVIIGASIMLTACGGGECDTDCHDAIEQAHGKKTILPVVCAASAVCQK